MTAERQNRAVVLRSVNVLAAAQTDRHTGGASRTVGVIEQPVFGRGFLQLFHFTAGSEPKPAIPSRWRAPVSIGGGLRGAWVRANWRARSASGAPGFAPLRGRSIGRDIIRGAMPPPDRLAPPAARECRLPAEPRLSAARTLPRR